MALSAAAEQDVVVVAPELVAEEIQRQRVDARVDERQAEAEDLEDVPEHVVLAGREVVPQHVDVTREPTHDEDGDEREHEPGDLVAGLRLRPPRRRGVPDARHVVGAGDEDARHQRVEAADDEHGEGEVDDEVEDGLPAPIRLPPGVGLAHADADRVAVRAVRVVLDVRDDGDGHGEQDREQPDGNGQTRRTAHRGGLAAAKRVSDGDVAVETEGDQREDRHPERHAAQELVQPTHRVSVRPLDQRVDGGRERYRHEDEQQVAARQVHDEDVRHVVHARVARHDEDEGAVAEDADDEDDEEDRGNDVGLGRAEEHRVTRLVRGRRVPTIRRRRVQQADDRGRVRFYDIIRHRDNDSVTTVVT